MSYRISSASFAVSRLIAVGCFLTMALAGVADAAPQEEPQGALTLSQAISAALDRNPDLQAAAFELQVAQARVAQAGLRPNPEVGLQLENFAGSGATSGSAALESTLSLSQVIELGGKRSRRQEFAQRGLDLVSVERQAQQLDVLAEVTRRFIHVVADQEQLTLTRRATGLAEATFAAIKKRVDAARSPEAELNRASIALARARIEQQHAEHELQSARRQLAALWGSTTPGFDMAQADIYKLPEIDDPDRLIAKLARTPDFLRFVSEARLRDAESRLARAQARSDVSLNLGVRRFEDSGDTALVAGISVPMPLFNRNQGAILESQARIAQSPALERAALVRISATLFEFYQELLHARNETETMRATVIPQAEVSLQQTQYGYERGRFSYLELATAQQELIEVQRAAIEAAANYHRLLAEIERLTGEPIATTTQDMP